MVAISGSTGSKAPTHPTHDLDKAQGAGPNRRHVIGLAAAAGAAGLLAACGGGDSDTGGGGAATGDGSGSGGGETAEETPAGDAPGQALVATADVPVGGGVVLEDQRIVVTQPEKGTFKGFSAVCTHQSCTVASVKEGSISCACHGSGFSASDGSVQGGPAPRPLPEVPVAVEGDQVVTA